MKKTTHKQVDEVADVFMRSPKANKNKHKKSPEAHSPCRKAQDK